MAYTLFNILYDYAFPFFHILISTIGIYTARILVGQTRNKAPLVLLIACSSYILLSLLSIFFNAIFSSTAGLNTTMIFWTAWGFGNIIASGLLFFAILLIAQDFRSFLETKKIQDSLPQPPHQP